MLNEMIEEKHNHNNIINFFKKNKYIEINLLHIYIYIYIISMYSYIEKLCNASFYTK